MQGALRTALALLPLTLDPDPACADAMLGTWRPSSTHRPEKIGLPEAPAGRAAEGAIDQVSLLGLLLVQHDLQWGLGLQRLHMQSPAGDTKYGDRSRSCAGT